MKTIKLTDKKGLTNTFEFDEMPSITIDGEIVVFESKKVEPKVGDLVKLVDDTDIIFAKIYDIKSRYICYNSRIKNGIFINSASVYGSYDQANSIEILTPDQFQSEVNNLGFQYYFESNNYSVLKWKPEKTDDYYYFNEYADMRNDTWRNTIREILMYKNGNCFKTKSECLAKIEQIKKILAL